MNPRTLQPGTPRRRRLATGRGRFATLAALAAAVATGLLAGCVHRSGGTWMISSASTPEGWPDLTPVGEVHIREYPAYRAAGTGDASGMRPSFMKLFNHIKQHDIAMTAPVEMTYSAGDQSKPRLETMAFLYRSPTLGEPGTEGQVTVADQPPQTYASVGVRGSYSQANYTRGLDILDRYLAEHPEWHAVGPARHLGYNSPFVPWFLRYGEVQIPVEPAAE